MSSIELRDQLVLGDAETVLKGLPDNCIDCCVTSIPYFNLRDYENEHQIGLEDTPEQYIERIVKVFVEVKRVLHKHGTLWLNIGDSYAGSGKGTGDDFTGRYKQDSNRESRKVSKSNRLVTGGLKPKDLIGIPWMVAFALRSAGYYLRQDIIWSKPNPMPESVRDRCTKSHEYLFLLSKSAKYYFDADAIKTPAADATVLRMKQQLVNQVREFTKPDTQ